MEGRKSPELANLFRSLHQDDTTLGQVVDIGREVEAMTSHPGWETVSELLLMLRTRGVDALTRGDKPLEQADYAQKLGFLNGVQTAIDAAATVIAVADEVRVDLERQALAGSG